MIKAINDNKKVFIFIFVLSFIFALLIDVFIFNRKQIKYNDSYSANITKIDGITKKNGWYNVDKKNAYIVIKLKDNYINKIKFKYKTNDDYHWHVISRIDNNDVILAKVSSGLTTNAVKKINLKTDEIKIVFENNKFKFKNVTVDNKIYINYSIIIFITLFISSFLILFRYRDYFNNNLDKTFLLIAVISGLMFIFFLPKHVYLSWDDQIHYENSYTFLSSSHISHSAADSYIGMHGKFTNNMFETQEELLYFYKSLNKLDRDTRKIVQINNYSLKFNKIVYLPFYLGLTFGRLFHLDYVLCFTLAKLFNFILYVIIMYFAIKISTYTKKLVFLISLLSSNLFLATNFSYDPTITAGLILATVCFLRIFEMKKVDYKYLLAFVLAVVWASLPKAVYAPFLFLALFIPNSMFNSKKEAYSIKLVIFFIAFLLIATFVLPMLIGGVAGDPRGGNTDASLQLKLILKNPIFYAKVLVLYLLKKGPNLFINTATSPSLGYVYYASNLKNTLSLINFIFILYILYTNPIDKKSFSKKVRLLFILLYGLLTILICTALYLSFTVVGSSTIAGLQPRYFYPLLLVFLMIISYTCNKKDIRENNTSSVVFVPYFSLMIVIGCFVCCGLGL